MNRIDKLKDVNARGEGILSCSLAPYGQHNFDKLLSDIQFLRECGLNQLLLLCYEPDVMKLAEIAPAEMKLLLRGIEKGSYNGLFFDNAKAVREKYPDLPLIATPMIGDTLRFGMGRFLNECKKVEIDGMDTAHYMSIEDPCSFRQRTIDSGIHFLCAVDAMGIDMNNPEHILRLDGITKISTGEILFVGGIPGEADKLDGKIYTPIINHIRQVQKENNIEARIIAIGGMNSPEDVYQMTKIAGCDGVHFSSAFIKRLLDGKYEEIKKWLKECKKAMES